MTVSDHPLRTIGPEMCAISYHAYLLPPFGLVRLLIMHRGFGALLSALLHLAFCQLHEHVVLGILEIVNYAHRAVKIIQVYSQVDLHILQRLFDDQENWISIRL